MGRAIFEDLIMKRYIVKNTLGNMVEVFAESAAQACLKLPGEIDMVMLKSTYDRLNKKLVATVTKQSKV